MNSKKIFNLIFNLCETLVIILFGNLIGVSYNDILMIMMVFFISRNTFKQPKHYNKWYRCAIWSLLTFLSLYTLVKIDLKLSIVMTIFTAYVISGKSDIEHTYLWSGKQSKYQSLKDFIGISPNNPIILDYEAYWRVHNPIRYEIFKLYFRDNKSYEDICKIKDYDNNNLIKQECKSIYEQLERPLGLPPTI